ncbi:MAG: hypothetical protein CSB06_00760 [Bacteroidia bacterium]|nr:MAG: hypothetical protein CSB06_00760 [Bacteroidia bacterium]
MRQFYFHTIIFCKDTTFFISATLFSHKKGSIPLILHTKDLYHSEIYCPGGSIYKKTPRTYSSGEKN